MLYNWEQATINSARQDKTQCIVYNVLLFFTHHFQINARGIVLTNKCKAYLEIQSATYLDIQQVF